MKPPFQLSEVYSLAAFSSKRKEEDVQRRTQDETMGSLAASKMISPAANAIDQRPKYTLFHMIELTGANAKRRKTLHGNGRCQPVGPSLILLGRCGADRTMTKFILFEIDGEIALLRQAKALLSSTGTTAIKRKPGRPSKTVAIVVPVAQKAKKRKKMNAEGRERVRQAQIKRWAVLKGVSKANLNATVAPLPRSKRKAAKSA